MNITLVEQGVMKMLTRKGGHFRFSTPDDSLPGLLRHGGMHRQKAASQFHLPLPSSHKFEREASVGEA